MGAQGATIMVILLYLFRARSTSASFAFLSGRMNSKRLQRLYPTYNTGTDAAVTSATPLPRLGLCPASSTTSETHLSYIDQYDEETWEKYTEIMDKVMRESRVIRKRLQIGDQQLELVQQYLLRPSPLWDVRQSPPIINVTSSIGSGGDLADCDESNNDKKDPRGSHIRQTLSQRKSEFLLKTNMTELAFAYCGRSLNYLADVCAKSQMPGPCLIAWSKIRECGLLPPENSVNTYLYVLTLTAGTSECELNNYTTTTPVSIHQQLSETLMDVATFHDALFETKEKSVAVRIKMLVAQGDAAAAEECLALLPSKSCDEKNQRQWKRLRTYMPILEYYCDSATGNVSSVMRVYREMRESAGVHFDAETYALVLGAVAKMSCIGSASDDDASSLLEAGPTLLEEVMDGMAVDLLDLDEASAESLLRDFQDGLSASGDESRQVYRLTAQRVSIDNTTALCPETGVRLRLFALSQDQKQELHDKLLHMAAVEHEEFFQKRGKGSKNQQRDGKLALKELSRFYDWLHVREGGPVTAFVDGPNVAYFGSGEMKWHHVQLVVDKLEAMGENPLVIMPNKYVSPSFTIRRGLSRVLPDDEVAVMNELVHTRRKVYVVPPDYFDDYYWMLGSIAAQKAESRKQVLHVPPNDPSGRFPGLRPMVITNDLMRDHRLDLLEERLFRRWTSCHMVAYSIKYEEETDLKNRKVALFPADFFSCEIQRNIAAKFGDNTTIWHVPVAGWPEHDRLCLMIMH